MIRNFRNRNFFKTFFSVFLGLALAGCGASTSITSVSGLPAASAGIGAALSARLTPNSAGLAPEGYVGGPLMAASTTGLKLSAWGTTTWDSTKSRAMCETGNALLQLYNRAQEVDKVKCYMGLMESQGAIPSTVNIYSGKNVDLQLVRVVNGSNVVMGDVRFNIAKSGKSIITFKMYSCFGENGQAPSSQSEYIDLDLTKTTAVSLTTINTRGFSAGSGNSGAFSGELSITGALDTNGNWSSKKATAQNYGTFSGTDSGGHTFNSHYGNLTTVDQTATQFTVQSNSTGTNSLVGGYTPSGCSGTPAQISFTTALYTLVDGINMGSPSKVALGDGATRGSMVNGYQDSGGNPLTGCGSTGSGVSSWIGDTQAKTTSNADTATATATAATLPTATVPTASTIAFGTGQSWDCSSTSWATITVTSALQTLMSSTCDAKFFGDDTYHDCSKAAF